MGNTVSLPVIPIPSSNTRATLADRVFLLVLPLGTFLLYFQTRHFQFLRYDDPLYVSGNWHVQTGLTLANLRWALTAVVSSNWHPLTLIVELVVAQFFGTSPAVFHLLNSVIHSINVALLYLFLRQATGSFWRAAIAAALWGWHPLRVESVAFVGELKDVLYGFFWLCGLLTYLRYRRYPSLPLYALLCLCLICALTSKPMAVTFPIALLLLEIWPLKTIPRNWRRRLLELLPLLLLCAAACLVTLYTQVKTDNVKDYGAAVRAAYLPVSYLLYLDKTFVPINLSLFYPHPASIGIAIPPTHAIAAALVLLLITAVLLAFRRSRPYLLAGWLWFIILLIPVIGVVQVGGQGIADRYTYIPSIGITFAVVWIFADYVVRGRALRFAAAALGVALSLVLWITTRHQIGYWRNQATLFAHSDQVTGRNYLARTSLAIDALAAGNSEQAITLAESAVEFCPQNEETHHALALALQTHGDLKRAFREFETAIRLNPTHAYIRNNFGGLLVEQNRTQDAMQQFQAAIHLDPDLTAARHNLAVLLAANGQYDQAILQWRQALIRDPGNPLYHGWLAEALRLIGDRAGAIEHYRAAFAAGEHNPTWESNFAWFIATDPSSSDDEIEQAITQSKDAVDQTNQPMALDAMAAALARTSRFDDAAAAASRAISIAQTQGKLTLAKEIQQRLNAYRAGRPYLVQTATTRPVG